MIDGKILFYGYYHQIHAHSHYRFPEEDPICASYGSREGWSGNEKGHAAMTELVDRYVGELFELVGELGNATEFLPNDITGLSYAPASLRSKCRGSAHPWGAPPVVRRPTGAETFS